MTMQEAGACYQIPQRLLQAYERWRQRGGSEKDQPYSDTDLERLSTIMTLQDLGFTDRETEIYMRLLLERTDSARERLRMLEQRRQAILEEIHLWEQRLARLDYLRHELRRGDGTGDGLLPGGAAER